MAVGVPRLARGTRLNFCRCRSVLISKKGECSMAGGLSRRSFFRKTVAITAGSLVGFGANFAAPRRAAMQTTLSPEAALREPMDGNQRYVTGNMTHHEHDLQVLKAKT